MPNPSNTVLSLVRTWVPIVVGSLISWLAGLGLNVNDDAQGAMTVLMTAILIGLYYTVVRLLEKQFPWIGVLLGAQAQPQYPAPGTTTTGSGDAVTPLYPQGPTTL
jgi:hypothetical protein